MGPTHQACVREVRQRWRRRSDEYEEPIQFPKGYSRNGVFGPTRGMEGHGCFPEVLAPSAAIAADDAGADGREEKEGGTSMLTPEALVHVKQEQSVDTDGESWTLRIDNFRRPFTLNAVKAFVQQCGPMENGGFWMDRIKTHCFVTFASMDVARAAKAVIDGTVWPSETGQRLSVSFATMTAMEVIVNGPPPAPTTPRANAGQQQPGPPSDESETVPRARVIRGRGAPAPISSRFLKTDAKPMLYYLPVSKSEVKFRKRNREASRQGIHDDSVKKQK